MSNQIQFPDNGVMMAPEFPTGAYHLKIIKSAVYPEDSDDTVVEEKIHLSVDGKGDITVEVDDFDYEGSDDEIPDEDSDEADGSLSMFEAYGQHTPPPQFFDAYVFTCAMLVSGERTVTLALKFVVEDENSVDFHGFNSGLSRVEFYDENNTFITSVQANEEEGEDLWFSNRMLNPNYDYETLETHEGKTVWALKWSRAIPVQENQTEENTGDSNDNGSEGNSD